jgi:hypothetical protein
MSTSIFQDIREKGINAETLRRMVAKVEEYSESHRAHGLPDDLLNNLKDDLQTVGPSGARPWDFAPRP